MSFTSAAFPSDPYSSKNWASEGVGGLVEQLYKTGQFLRGLRVKMRFGELTRAPIRLIRLQIRDEEAECDWLARSADQWDADLARSVQQRHVSLQALRDAIDVRALLFDIMPQVEMAHFNVFRESANCTQELIITGSTHRNDHTARDVHSLAMRAKVLGFRFNMEGDKLRRIPAHEPVLSGEKSADRVIEPGERAISGPSRDISS
jgi:hypothetical protein